MELKLPTTLSSVQDLHRLSRELEALDTYIDQASLRGQPLTALPRMTNVLESIVRDNNFDLMQATIRRELRQTVATYLKTAPVIHMSFAVEPPVQMVQKIVSWFREKVHPATILQVGIQPTIAAGCVLRTPNKYFDFSLRQHLKRNQDKLAASIREHSEAELRSTASVVEQGAAA